MLSKRADHCSQVSDEDRRKYELVKEENKKRAPDDQKYEESNRGLLFTCYQSSLVNGFARQTMDFGNNDFWPATSILPTNHGMYCNARPDKLGFC